VEDSIAQNEDLEAQELVGESKCGPTKLQGQLSDRNRSKEAQEVGETIEEGSGNPGKKQKVRKGKRLSGSCRKRLASKADDSSSVEESSSGNYESGDSLGKGRLESIEGNGTETDAGNLDETRTKQTPHLTGSEVHSGEEKEEEVGTPEPYRTEFSLKGVSGDQLNTLQSSDVDREIGVFDADSDKDNDSIKEDLSSRKSGRESPAEMKKRIRTAGCQSQTSHS
jgi:hypothetical protein